MDMVLHVELKQYLNLYNKKTLTFLQLAFSLYLRLKVTDFAQRGLKFFGISNKSWGKIFERINFAL